MCALGDTFIIFLLFSQETHSPGLQIPPIKPIPFIPIWKTKPLSISRQDARIVFGAMRLYNQSSCPWTPRHKFSNDLSEHFCTLLKRLKAYLAASPAQPIELLSFELSTEEALVAWQAFYHYSFFVRHELPTDTLSLIEKIQRHLFSTTSVDPN